MYTVKSEYEISHSTFAAALFPFLSTQPLFRDFVSKQPDNSTAPSSALQLQFCTRSSNQQHQQQQHLNLNIQLGLYHNLPLWRHRAREARMTSYAGALRLSACSGGRRPLIGCRCVTSRIQTSEAATASQERSSDPFRCLLKDNHIKVTQGILRRRAKVSQWEMCHDPICNGNQHII